MKNRQEIEKLVSVWKQMLLKVRPDQLAALWIASGWVEGEDIEIHTGELPISLGLADLLSDLEFDESSGRLQLYSSSPGAQYQFPHALFYGPNKDETGIGKGSLSDQISKEIQRLEAHKAESREVNRFFHLSEQYLFRLKTEIELLKIHQYEHPTAILSEFFDLPAWLDQAEKKLLCRLLPLAAPFIGDLVFLKFCLEKTLAYPVKIYQIPPEKINIDAEGHPEMGEALLGIDAVMGQQIETAETCILLIVGPVLKEELDIRAASGADQGIAMCRLYRLTDLLCRYLLPAWQPYDIQLEVERKNALHLSTEENISRMGFSYLNGSIVSEVMS